MLTCIAVFPLERDVFYREYEDGGYSSMAFLLSYYILSLPTLLFSSIIVSVLVTYAIGLNASLYGFLVFTYVLGCFLFVGECIGVIFSAIFLNVGVSVNAMSLVIACFCQMSGLISASLPQAMIDFNVISPIRWGSIIIMNTVLKGLVFTCSSSEQDSSGQCPFQTGQQILELYQMSSNHTNLLMVYLAIVTSIFFFISLAIFRLKALHISH
eukprot:gene16676-22805_t